MSLTLKDLEIGLEKYKAAITGAENDKEFAEMVVEALEQKIGKMDKELIQDGE